MANERHLKILKKGVAAWNDWREQTSDPAPDLSDVDLQGRELQGVDFAQANLAHANLAEAKLNGGDLNCANLGRAELKWANLAEANLEGADVAEANLWGANLKRLYAVGADFAGANLSGADLTGATLERADLAEADLTSTLLRGADLRLADLTLADLSDAQLHFASFYNTYLGGTKLTRASVGWTAFIDCDLTAVEGLNTVLHQGPSGIGIDTIYKSKGNIPEAFLRGAGVPDIIINYVKSVAGAKAAVEFYSCFISYSTEDQEFADRFYADLQAKGVRCWFAPHDVRAGRKVHEQIDEAIRLHDRLLLILSPNSMSSEWVKTEIAKARKLEARENMRVLFPIRLAPFEALRDWECFDPDTGKDSAREIREYFIPDFSNWKDHDSYQQAFERLVSDLKTENPKRAPSG